MHESFAGAIRLPEPSMASRKITFGSKGHCTGQLVVGPGAGRVVTFESHLELDCALVLIARPEAADLFEQVAFEWHDQYGEVRTHYFDFVVLQHDQDRIGYTVKPSTRVNATFLEQISRVSKQARQKRFVKDVRLLTERDFDAIDLFNARLLHGMREPDPEYDAAAAEVVSEMTGMVPLRDLTLRIGTDARGFRALIRLIRARCLWPVGHKKISPCTEVYKRSQPDAAAI